MKTETESILLLKVKWRDVSFCTSNIINAPKFFFFKCYDLLRVQTVVFCLYQQRVPEFNSMFSNLPHHPRFTLRLEATDPVPAFIDRSWRGFGEQKRQTLQRLTG